MKVLNDDSQPELSTDKKAWKSPTIQVISGEKTEGKISNPSEFPTTSGRTIGPS